LDKGNIKKQGMTMGTKKKRKAVIEDAPSLISISKEQK
jgi:hypothetical protein